jgi:hypothetical protein
MNCGLDDAATNRWPPLQGAAIPSRCESGVRAAGWSLRQRENSVEGNLVGGDE